MICQLFMSVYKTFIFCVCIKLVCLFGGNFVRRMKRARFLRFVNLHVFCWDFFRFLFFLDFPFVFFPPLSLSVFLLSQKKKKKNECFNIAHKKKSVMNHCDAFFGSSNKFINLINKICFFFFVGRKLGKTTIKIKQ